MSVGVNIIHILITINIHMIQDTQEVLRMAPNRYTLLLLTMLVLLVLLVRPSDGSIISHVSSVHSHHTV